LLCRLPPRIIAIALAALDVDALLLALAVLLAILPAPVVLAVLHVDKGSGVAGEPLLRLADRFYQHHLS
jgi:hypothetical protein